MEVRTGLGEAELVDAIGGFDALVVRSQTRVTEAVLDAAMTTSVGTAAVSVELIGRFAGVYLVDSTQIALPDSLTEVWRGTGSTTGTRAALKTQVQLDLAARHPADDDRGARLEPAGVGQVDLQDERVLAARRDDDRDRDRCDDECSGDRHYVQCCARYSSAKCLDDRSKRRRDSFGHSNSFC